MSTHIIRISNEESTTTGEWTAVLYEVFSDGTATDSTAIGLGDTAREAIADLNIRN